MGLRLHCNAWGIGWTAGASRAGGCCAHRVRLMVDLGHGDRARPRGLQQLAVDRAVGALLLQRQRLADARSAHVGGPARQRRTRDRLGWDDRHLVRLKYPPLFPLFLFSSCSPVLLPRIPSSPSVLSFFPFFYNRIRCRYLLFVPTVVSLVAVLLPTARRETSIFWVTDRRSWLAGAELDTSWEVYGLLGLPAGRLLGP